MRNRSTQVDISLFHLDGNQKTIYHYGTVCSLYFFLPSWRANAKELWANRLQVEVGRCECVCWAFRILKIRNTTILISYTFEQLLSLKYCRHTHTHTLTLAYAANRSHLLCIISHWFEIYFDWFNFGQYISGHRNSKSIVSVQSGRDISVLEATASIHKRMWRIVSSTETVLIFHYVLCT